MYVDTDDVYTVIFYNFAHALYWKYVRMHCKTLNNK